MSSPMAARARLPIRGWVAPAPSGEPPSFERHVGVPCLSSENYQQILPVLRRD